MTRRHLLALAPLGIAGCGSLPPLLPPAWPPGLARRISRTCRQAVLVVADRPTTHRAQLWMMERRNADAAWTVQSGPEPAVLGRNGLAWGLSPLTPSDPPHASPEWRLKREGDGCSPAGVFALPFAFGKSAPRDTRWLRLPYVHATPGLRGIDDPDSRYYNQLVDETRLPAGAAKDWRSSETMRRSDAIYDWGVFVAHNHPRPVRRPLARGSCIFIHRWEGPDEGTAGCTALSAASLSSLLQWLDPAAEPVLVQSAAHRPDTSSL